MRDFERVIILPNTSQLTCEIPRLKMKKSYQLRY